jgi:hypothetical protein
MINITSNHLSISLIYYYYYFTCKQLIAFLRLPHEPPRSDYAIELFSVFLSRFNILVYFYFSFICSQMGTCRSEAAFEKYLPQLEHSTSLISSALRKHLSSSLTFTICASFFIWKDASLTIFFISGKVTSCFYLKFITVALLFG